MLQEINFNDMNRICVLVIGKYGIGKTSLLYNIMGYEYNDDENIPYINRWRETANPSKDKAIVLSAESGLLSVRKMGLAGKIKGYMINTLEDFIDAYRMLNSSEEIKQEYNWVFIDSLTEIAYVIEKYMEEKYNDPSKTFKMWNAYYKKLIEAIKKFRDMDHYNVVFTCLSSIDKDEQNRRYVGPMMGGQKVKEVLPALFDEVFYMMSDDKGKRVLITQPYDRMPAKDRSGMLSPVEPPYLLEIKNKILVEEY